MDLAVLEVHGNLLPATAGLTSVKRFTIGPSTDEADRPPAIEREGPDGSIAHLFSLPGSDETDRVYLGTAPDVAAPEIRLTAVQFIAGSWVVVPNGEWTWRRELLGVNSALPTSTDFRLDDGFWRRIVGYQRIGTEIVHQDYATGLGKTIRFGDGEFGEVPADGVSACAGAAVVPCSPVLVEVGGVAAAGSFFAFFAFAGGCLAGAVCARALPAARLRAAARQSRRSIRFTPENARDAGE